MELAGALAVVATVSPVAAHTWIVAYEKLTSAPVTQLQQSSTRMITGLMALADTEVKVSVSRGLAAVDVGGERRQRNGLERRLPVQLSRL